MSTRGHQKHNNTGRSTNALKKHNQGKIEGPFITHTKELLASPAWGILTRVDRKILDRLEIEHMNHAGTENGNLTCTYSDFEAFGIRRPSIANSLLRLESLGLIEIVERGRITRSEFKHPSIYRLTYVLGNIPATNEWRLIKDKAAAERKVKPTVKSRKYKTNLKAEKQKTGYEIVT